LPNAETLLVRQRRTAATLPVSHDWQGLEWMQSKHSDEYQLEGKSGASSCGNSSSKGVY